MATPTQKIGAAVFAVATAVAGFAVGQTVNVPTEIVTKVVSGVAPGAEAPTAPIRVTYRDISLKVIGNTTSPLLSFRGNIATQVTRDAMEEEQAAVALPETYRFIRTIPGCNGAADTIVSNMDSITGKLGPIYEFNAIGGNGSWSLPVNGRHYTFEKYALRAAQQCAAGSSHATACATSSLLTNDLADLLDIRVDNGRCVIGATDFVPIPLTEKVTSQREIAGEVVAKAATAFVPLTAQQTALLLATHAAHVAVSDYRCGVGPQPDVNVQAAHMALEATATSETMHHFLRMKDFSGFADLGSPDGKAAGWSPADVCKIARAQDAAHLRWVKAIMAGDWLTAREADNDHQLFHIMMNMRDTNLLMVFSPFVVHPADPHFRCLPNAGLPTSSRLDCPKLTEDQVLAGL